MLSRGIHEKNIEIWAKYVDVLDVLIVTRSVITYAFLES